MGCNQFARATTRREMLKNSACGMGQLAFAAMASQLAQASPNGPQTPVGQTQIPARAKRVHFFCLCGEDRVTLTCSIPSRS